MVMEGKLLLSASGLGAPGEEVVCLPSIHLRLILVVDQKVQGTMCKAEIVALVILPSYSSYFFHGSTPV